MFDCDLKTNTKKELDELKQIHNRLKKLFGCVSVNGMTYCGHCFWCDQYKCAVKKIKELIDFVEHEEKRKKEEKND